MLITSDSLRAGNMSVYGYERNTTPFLDQLSMESTVFTNAYSVGPSSASMSGTMTSTIPLTRGAYFSIPADLPTIAESLPDEYTKIAVHSHGLFVEETGFKAGFDEFVQLERDKTTSDGVTSKFKSRVKDLLTRSDLAFSASQSIYRKLKENVITPTDPRVGGSRTFERARELLEEAQPPVFLWVHLMDTHSPFIPDSEFLAEFAPEMTMKDVSQLVVYRNANDTVDPNDERIQAMIDVYDAEIRRTDSLIESFLRKTRSESQLESPVFIISADHGEAFGEHKWMGHPPEALYDETLWIPLILYDSTSAEARSDSTVVSSIDIGPTVCQFAECDVPPPFRGKSLLATDQWERGGVFSLASHESRWVLNPDKLRVRYRTKNWSYVYCASDADELYRTDEQQNVIESNPEIAERLRSKIDTILESVTYPDEADLTISETNKQRLRNLGYIVE